LSSDELVSRSSRPGGSPRTSTGHPARLDGDLLDLGGRSYHPHLARFFSPDPLVVSPLDAQAYNRYSYVHNRPLVATDPTGYATDFGDDDRLPGKLGETCEENGDCSRLIVVSDPDYGGNAYDTWQRASAMFDAYNGLGQGGPEGGGGYPYSPNGVRHGTDAGQPGGSPAFTTEVTPDMCAEISACSGRLSKRGPVYIWDAPIDDWARAAVDIGTDFIPGVAQAKTAYDAYQRIQSGEDPVDVLVAAGGEAALGLIPGLKAGNKARKTLAKADDVADAAGDVGHALGGGTATRVAELGGTIPAAQQGRVTMGVGLAEDASGAQRVLVGTSEPRGYLRPGVTLAPGEMLASGLGHAEADIVKYAQQNGLRLLEVGATRPICPACAAAIAGAGARAVTPLK
jgi:RHS repeat-associated protein